jgi:broad specificity phosphatase PhoE
MTVFFLRHGLSSMSASGLLRRLRLLAMTAFFLRHGLSSMNASGLLRRLRPFKAAGQYLSSYNFFVFWCGFDYGIK